MSLIKNQIEKLNFARPILKVYLSMMICRNRLSYQNISQSERGVVWIIIDIIWRKINR
jgi:hypothetical protein